MRKGEAVPDTNVQSEYISPLNVDNRHVAMENSEKDENNSQLFDGNSVILKSSPPMKEDPYSQALQKNIKASMEPTKDSVESNMRKASQGTSTMTPEITLDIITARTAGFHTTSNTIDMKRGRTDIVDNNGDEVNSSYSKATSAG